MKMTIETPIFKHPLRDDVFFLIETGKNSVMFNGTLFTITLAYQRVSRAALARFCKRYVVSIISDSGEQVTINNYSDLQRILLDGLDIETLWLNNKFICPYCGSYEVIGPSDDMDTPTLDEDTTQFNQAYSCRSCESTWVEKYSIKFEGVE